MDQWAHKDCLQVQIFLPEERSNLLKAVSRGAEVRLGEGWESENNGKEKTASAEGIHSRGGRCVLLPNLAGSMFGCHRSALFVPPPRTPPDTELKNALWENPSWHMTQCKGRSQREAASRGWHGLDALGHSTGSPAWVALPTEARVQFAQFSWELTVKPRAPVNWAKEESKDPAPCLETHKERHFKRNLVKRRKNYTQILEENWNGFLKRI